MPGQTKKTRKRNLGKLRLRVKAHIQAVRAAVA
jgi:hypothetical protein